MVAYKNKETLSRRYSIGRNTSRRIAYVLGVCLYCAASTAAAVDSETWHYGLDNVGNITSRGTDSQNPTHNYGYDGVYRLTDETNPSNTDQYSYDSNSNRTSFTRDGSSTSYQIDSNSNRLTQVGSDVRTYDNIGNTKTDRNGTRTFTYNQAGRLVQVHENSQLLATYTYNAHGQRTIKTTPSGTTYYLYGGGGQLIGEYDETGQPIKEYVRLNGEPIAQLESSNITYLHSDHLATPRKATNETGDVVWKWDSEAFGNKPPESSGTTVNLRFPGQYYDSETGLNYNYFRYYDPSMGRYITSDPIGLRGGLNTYAYVGGNPLSRIDYYGLRGTPWGVVINWVWRNIRPAPPPPIPPPGGWPTSDVPIVPMPGNASNDGGPMARPKPVNARGNNDPYSLPKVNPGRSECGKCNPCPDDGEIWCHVHADGSRNCHQIVYNQNPNTCECNPKRIHLPWREL